MHTSVRLRAGRLRVSVTLRKCRLEGFVGALMPEGVGGRRVFSDPGFGPYLWAGEGPAFPSELSEALGVDIHGA